MDPAPLPLSQPNTAGTVVDDVPAAAPAPEPINAHSIQPILPPTPAPSGDGTATAEHTEADLPDTDNMMQPTGDVTKGHEDGIEAVGWKHDQAAVPVPIIKRLPNEQLWQLIRRFDMQMYHVKAIEGPVPGGLDLNISEEEEFSPDKLRANFERLYMTVIIGVAGFAKHTARLRSWNERRRTSAFCAAYVIAWTFNLVLPLILSTLIALIVYPPSRPYLFPPAPLAIVSSTTGGLQVPKAGDLGSGNSLTGAPEAHKGEAVEKEASNFVSGLASIALSSVAGKGPKNKGEHEKEADLDDSLPDPTSVVIGVNDSKSKSDGGKTSEVHDKTKVPVQDAMWTKARPVMRIIGDIADGWERFGNALSPTPPYHANRARMRLASYIAPVVVITIWMKPALVIKATGALFGFGFFGQPLIDRGILKLNKDIPNWQKALELRNTILKGVPTNAQLTLTLLRIAEENKAPLPPPPVSQEEPTADPLDPELDHDIPEDTAAPDPDSSESQVHDPTGGAPDPNKKEVKKHGHKITSFLKSTTRTGVSTFLGADKVKAKIGSEAAKQRLGVLPEKDAVRDDGPVEYRARWNGKKGRVFITLTAVTPSVSFANETLLSTTTDPVLSIHLKDIRELKKLGGLGWKAKLVVGFALNMETADGLEVVYYDGKTGKEERVKFMAMLRRDELFNRLIALGGRKWECW